MKRTETIKRIRFNINTLKRDLHKVATSAHFILQELTELERMIDHEEKQVQSESLPP